MRAWRGVVTMTLGLTLALCLAIAGCTSDDADPPARPKPSAAGASGR